MIEMRTCSVGSEFISLLFIFRYCSNIRPGSARATMDTENVKLLCKRAKMARQQVDLTTKSYESAKEFKQSREEAVEAKEHEILARGARKRPREPNGAYNELNDAYLHDAELIRLSEREDGAGLLVARRRDKMLESCDRYFASKETFRQALASLLEVSVEDLEELVRPY